MKYFLSTLLGFGPYKNERHKKLLSLEDYLYYLLALTLIGVEI